MQEIQQQACSRYTFTSKLIPLAQSMGLGNFASFLFKSFIFTNLVRNYQMWITILPDDHLHFVATIYMQIHIYLKWFFFFCQYLTSLWAHCSAAWYTELYAKRENSQTNELSSHTTYKFLAMPVHLYTHYWFKNQAHNFSFSWALACKWLLLLWTKTSLSLNVHTCSEKTEDIFSCHQLKQLKCLSHISSGMLIITNRGTKF